MTPISKVETLIKYARFGMSMSEILKGNQTKLYLPKSITSIDFSTRIGFNIEHTIGKLSTEVTGRVKKIGGQAAFSKGPLKFVDLPECIECTAGAQFASATLLKECHLPKLNTVGVEMFGNCPALEILEVGSLESMGNISLQSCTSLHTFICGEGTRCNLFLYHSTELTQECLHNIIDNLADRTGLSAYSLHIGEINIAKISDEYKSKLIEKNWKLL